MKGQSAIEYLMSYGWMLLVVAVVGGAVFSVLSDQDIHSISGFNSNDLIVDDFGYTSNTDLSLSAYNSGPEKLNINKIIVSSKSNEVNVTGGPIIGVSEDKNIGIEGFSQTESSNNVDIEVIYSSSGLKNLSAQGTVTGKIAIDESYSKEWWWNESWGKRIPIYIENPSSKNLKNYQIEVEIDTASLVSDGSLSQDCSDIRFLSSANNKVYDHWVREECGSKSTKIWTEISSINSSSTEKIYMYIDNAEADQKSSPEKTAFIYDLHGNGYDGELTGDTTYNSTEEYLEFTTPNNGKSGGYYYQKVPKPGFKAEFEHFAGGGSGADATFLAAYLDSPIKHEEGADTGYNYVLDEWNGNTIQLNYDYQRNPLKTPSFDIDDSKWRNVVVEFDGENSHRIFVNENLQVDTVVNKEYENSGDYFGWGARTGGATNYHRVRNLSVRKFMEPEPRISYGELETYR